MLPFVPKMPSRLVIKPDMEETALRILRANAMVIAEKGMAASSTNAVAKLGGFSRRPVMDRFPNKFELSRETWQVICEPQLIADLTECLSAVGLDSDEPDLNRSLDALYKFVSPSNELKAAREFLLATHFDETMPNILRRFLNFIDQTMHCEPILAAKRAITISLCLGLLVTTYLHKGKKTDLTTIAEKIIHVSSSAYTPRTIPSSQSPVFNRTSISNSGDELLDNLLNTALVEIATNGFENVSTNRLTQLAGVSEGFLFARYKTKFALFDDLIAKVTEISITENAQYMQKMAEEFGEGMADTIVAIDALNPKRRIQLGLANERIRLTLHRAELQETTLAQIKSAANFAQTSQTSQNPQDEVIIAFTLGEGLILLPQLFPEAHKLPLDAFFVPFAK